MTPEDPEERAPSTEAVAEALGENEDLLLEFIERHPNPTPDTVLSYAGLDAADAADAGVSRRRLSRWLRGEILRRHRQKTKRGARPFKRAEFAVGDVVDDELAADDDPLVVINTPPVPARKWTVFETGDTVATANPQYDRRAPVVLVMQRADLEAWRPQWDAREPVPATEVLGEVEHQALPEPRLTLREPRRHETRTRLEAIARALGDGRREVRVDHQDERVRLCGFFEQYAVAPDGTVDSVGFGPRRVEKKAQKALEEVAE
jgi:hypothetical protein